MTGATSHHATFAKLGLELVERGHDFTLLLSSGDTLGQDRLARPPFNELRQVKFAGPEGTGTSDSLSDLDRNPAKVQITASSWAGITHIGYTPLLQATRAALQILVVGRP